jgi:hypothetical protein
MQQILESLSIFVVRPWQDELAGLMWCIFLAVIAAYVFTIAQRQSLGKAVKILMDAECFSEERAKTAKELPGFREKAVKKYDRMIETVKEEGEPARYFLPEDRHKKAEALFKAASNPFWQVLLGIIGFYLALVILYYILPFILEQFQ